MAKLTNVEKFAIQGMLQNNKTSDQIAKEIKKPVELIDTYLTELNVSLEKVVRISKANKAGYATKTTSNNEIGGAIMTQSSAERGDSFHNKIAQPKDWGNRVHIIDPNKK